MVEQKDQDLTEAAWTITRQESFRLQHFKTINHSFLTNQQAMEVELIRLNFISMWDHAISDTQEST